ncbi:hypothetical protein [Lysobacter sp. Hz 25]|uniref:hypothetical protein n=1 Tax=Lysobacter sp. Hz 25 TaxID=3383698 RepID=UPI0038D3F3B9
MIRPIDGPSFPSYTPPANDPAPVEVGTPTYYEQRLADFQARNPGVEPPDYYLGYGDKYMERFAALDSTDLSPEGLEWRDKTTLALQTAIEDYRIRDPQGFADLERDPDAFRRFAFASHPDAYVDSGLYGLSVQDLTVIALTPDIGDVLNQEGIDQTKITIGKLEPEDVPEILGDTGVQYLRDAGPFAFTPLGPSLAVGRQGERLFDRLTEQSWFPDITDLPPVGLPDLNLDLLPDVDLPDMSLPDIDLPDIDLPDDIPGIPGI